jgi:PAS domain S-box-containing protein
MKSRPTPELTRWLAPWHTQPLRIALLYAIVSGVWIITSDTAVYWLAPDHGTANLINVIKGWAFVAATTGMLWLLVRRLLIRIGTSEAELQASEEQARAVFNGVNDAIFIHDAQTGAILSVNDTACRMFGHTREEFQHLSVEDISSGVVPYTQKDAREIIERVMIEKQATFEWRSRHRDGGLFWTEVNARPAIIGNQTRLLVTVRDINKRKRALDQVRKLSRAVEQSPVSIIITDPAGDIEYVNPATCRLTGYSPEELIGENPRLLKSDHTPPLEYERLWETIRQGGEWRGEFRNRKKGGELYWEAASISAITDDAGEITHFLAVKENVTERRKAEEKLRNQEALLEETAEIAHVGGWDFDPSTGKGSRSAEVCRIFDIDPALELDANGGMRFFHGESRTHLDAALAAAVKDGTPYDLELELVSATGRTKWVRAIGRPVMENRRVVRVRGTLQDITERISADQELRESRARLRALLARLQNTREEERTRIAREVHDVLGQLLTGMKMDLSWFERRLARLADESLRSEFAGKLTGTHALADSMLDCVQKISRDLRPSLLDNLGLTAALQFEARQFVTRTGIACEITSMPATVELSPDASTHVFRIFQEILTNAARHSDASRVRVALLRNGGELTLEVEDNGCGISMEAQQDAASLGLLGMSERAALIGGRIRFHGAPGTGTTVTLTIPGHPI